MNNSGNQHESVLAYLRSLMPERRLTYAESLRIAELQANRLVELFDIEGPHVPSELVSEFPRVEVRYVYDVPVGGASYWENGRWVIELRSWEPRTRQRFSLMHEFKHILDHSCAERAYQGMDHDTIERIADYFAACALMPKRWLKSQWIASGQNIVRLAPRLGVSAQALNNRLWHLGLSSAAPRCLAMRPNNFER